MRISESADDSVNSLSPRTVATREPQHGRPLVISADEAMGVLIELKSWHEAKSLAAHASVWYDCFRTGSQLVKWVPWQSLHVILPRLPSDTIITCIDDLALIK